MFEGMTVRRRWLPAVAVLSTALVAASVVVASTASGATSTTLTITAVSPHLVAATTDKQLITITGTGLTEDTIDSVAVAGCTSVIYTGSNDGKTLTIKTDNTCAAGANKVVTITDSDSNTAVSVPGATGGAQALSFIAPPTIATATATVRPVVTANTAGLGYADQQTSASVSGGGVIKVTAGATPFVNTTATPLAASLGGVALTKITMATGGTSFTGTLGARAAISNPVLVVTSGGVSKSFAYGAGGANATAGTHDFGYAGVTVSATPASGPANGGGTLTVAGSGFTTSTVVTIGATTCTKVTQSATSFTCTIPASTTAGPAVVTATTGAVVSVVSAGSIYTYLTQ